MKPKLRFRISLITVALAVIALGTAGCSVTDQPIDPNATATTLRLGYFDNVTHAPALVGIHQGIFDDDLGETLVQTQTFSAGPAAIEALSSGALDAVYIGPSPSINSYIKSGGNSLVIVSGAAVGGAGLVVSEKIQSVDDLAGKIIGSPQLGNTQDVALRTWLKGQGFDVPLEGQGEVTVSPAENSTNFDLFKAGKIQAAWVPEPWLSRFVTEAGGHVLVDEATLWPDGKFPTTVLAVNKDFYEKYPRTVKELVQANVDAISWINQNPGQVGVVINKVLEKDTGKSLKDEVLASSLARVTFTWNPEAQTYETLLNNAVALKLASQGSLVGILQVTDLNDILSKTGKKTVSTAGLE